MGSKKKKPAYDPRVALRSQCLKPELEPMARELHELSSKGSKDVWPELGAQSFKDNADLQKKFLTAAHKGMNEAQRRIIECIKSDEPLSASHDILFRGITDSMAWQFMGSQLCHARRFFKGQPPVNLKESNFDSVVFCSQDMARTNPGSMSIISDLTTFIHVGDLLTMDSRGKLTIAEVKEGRKNHQIMEFMNFFIENQCPHAFEYFAREHGKSGVKQLERMTRQLGRMGHVTEVMNSGKSRDPDTSQTIHIPDEFVYIGTWEDELNKVLEGADTNGWALATVDDCLFIGAYSHDSFGGGGHVIFNLWFDEFDGGIGSPRFRLNDCMTSPLALPIFNLSISDEHKFDLLFGRKNVCLGLNISAFLEKLEASGIKVREATNKETSRMEQNGAHPYRWKGKGICLRDGEADSFLMDGIFMRVFFHGQRPIDTMKAILGKALL